MVMVVVSEDMAVDMVEDMDTETLVVAMVEDMEALVVDMVDMVMEDSVDGEHKP